MKKSLLMLTALLFVGSSAFAQLEIMLGVGYGLPAFERSGGATTMTGDKSDPTIANLNYSLGGGIPIHFGVGVPLMEHVTFNADFCYWLGSATVVSDLNTSTDIGGGIMLDETDVTTFTSNQFRFNPAVTFSSEMGLYARTGLVIPLGGKTTFVREASASAGGTTFEATVEGETGGVFTLGAQTALGYNIAIADNMKLGIEVAMVALNIQGKSLTLTSYTDSNGDGLEDMFPTTYEQEANYVDELDGNSNSLDHQAPADVDFDAPRDELAGRTSFGAWGFNFRFAYILGQ